MARSDVTVFVAGYKAAWRDHPPSALELSPDPREFDAPSRERCWASLLNFVVRDPVLKETPISEVEGLFDEAWGRPFGGFGS